MVKFPIEPEAIVQVSVKRGEHIRGRDPARKPLNEESHGTPFAP